MHPSLTHTGWVVRVESSGKDQKTSVGLSDQGPHCLYQAPCHMLDPTARLMSIIVSSSRAILCSLCQNFSSSCFLWVNPCEKTVGISSVWATKESMSSIPTWEKLLQKCAKREILKSFFIRDRSPNAPCWGNDSWYNSLQQVWFVDRPDHVGVTHLGDFSTLLEWGREGMSCKYACHVVPVQKLFSSGCTRRLLCTPAHSPAHSCRFILSFRNVNPHGHGGGSMSARRQIFLFKTFFSKDVFLLRWMRGV